MLLCQAGLPSGAPPGPSFVSESAPIPRDLAPDGLRGPALCARPGEGSWNRVPRDLKLPNPALAVRWNRLRWRATDVVVVVPKGAVRPPGLW
jgi:hypothetical protein